MLIYFSSRKVPLLAIAAFMKSRTDHDFSPEDLVDHLTEISAREGLQLGFPDLVGSDTNKINIGAADEYIMRSIQQTNVLEELTRYGDSEEEIVNSILVGTFRILFWRS